MGGKGCKGGGGKSARWGVREPLQVTPTLRDEEAEELGFVTADAIKREGEACRRGKGQWALGKGERWALPRLVRENRTEDTREGKVPERQGQATMTISDSEKRGKSPKLGLGLNA